MIHPSTTFLTPDHFICWRLQLVELLSILYRLDPSSKSIARLDPFICWRQVSAICSVHDQHFSEIHLEVPSSVVPGKPRRTLPIRPRRRFFANLLPLLSSSSCGTVLCSIAFGSLFMPERVGPAAVWSTPQAPRASHKHHFRSMDRGVQQAGTAHV